MRRNGQVVKVSGNTHALKCWPDEFSAIIDGKKRFEWRKDDRGGYLPGDLLRLMEWDPVFEQYTGAWCMVQVTYALRSPGFGVPAGYCILSISPLLVNWRDDQRLMRAENKP